MDSFQVSAAQINYVGVVFATICSIHVVTMALLSPEFAGKGHLAAHQVVSFVAFGVLAALGTYQWLSMDSSWGGCFEDHMTGYCASSELLVKLMLGFQTYEVLIALYVPKLRGPGGQHLIHHACVLLLAVLGIGYTYTYYYAGFFFGMVELSSVPLSLMDLFKYCPHLAAKFPTVAEKTKELFAGSFLLTRVVYFPYMSSGFWSDALEVLSSGGKRQIPVGVPLAFLASNVILTGLQFYWGSLVIKGIIRKLKGAKEEHIE